MKSVTFILCMPKHVQREQLTPFQQWTAINHTLRYQQEPDKEKKKQNNSSALLQIDWGQDQNIGLELGLYCGDHLGNQTILSSITVHMITHHLWYMGVIWLLNYVQP